MLVPLVAAGCSGADGTTPRLSSDATTATAGAVSAPAGTGRTGVLVVRVQEGEQCAQMPRTPDPRCSPVPLPATGVTVLDSEGTEVARARSEAGGMLRLSLPAGSYTVRGERLAQFALTPEQPGWVTPDGTVEVVLTYGNGFQ